MCCRCTPGLIRRCKRRELVFSGCCGGESSRVAAAVAQMHIIADTVKGTAQLCSGNCIIKSAKAKRLALPLAAEEEEEEAFRMDASSTV